MLNPTVQDSQPTTEDMQWWKNQTGFCLCCSRSSGRRYLVRESCLIHRLDLWPHVIFLPFQGELFLYQMREPGEFSINMCSGLISPPMSSSSSDWSILHTHRNRVCVCVCVCVCARARTRRVPWWVLPWGPCRSWSLSGCTPRPCAPGCFEMASSWNQATSPQRSTPFTLIPSQSQHPCSLLLPYLVSWFYVCVCACMHECLHVQLFLIPWIIAHQAPLSMGFSSQEYWSVLPFPPPGDFPSPGIEPCSPVSPALASRSLTIMPPEKPLILLICP